MNKQNYQRILEQTLANIEESVSKGGSVPTLLLHSCCAPCSSYVLEYLSEYFRITVFYYNPNIYPEEEYRMRVKEQQTFIQKLPAKYPVSFEEGRYDTERFYAIAKGLEQVPEGGERCFRCYELRLREAAELAKERNFDYFTTTLSVSPHKNDQMLNLIGEELEKQYGVRHLPADFKKREGYKRSIELSKQYGLYRQDYCGCEFSLRQAREQQGK